jgi:hypothetical protein
MFTVDSDEVSILQRNPTSSAIDKRLERVNARENRENSAEIVGIHEIIIQQGTER